MKQFGPPKYRSKLDLLNPDAKIVFERKQPFYVMAIYPFLKEEEYSFLMNSFPSVDIMSYVEAVGHKYCLAEEHPAFEKYILENPRLCAYYKWLKSDKMEEIVHRMFLDLSNYYVRKMKFEFSALPPDGGHLTPHPDTKKKIVTGVLYLAPDDWEGPWGGHFSMGKPLVPIDDITEYPRVAFDEVEFIAHVFFRPNTMVFMLRSDISYHCVYPIKAPAGRWRNSITINLIGRRNEP